MHIVRSKVVYILSFAIPVRNVVIQVCDEKYSGPARDLIRIAEMDEARSDAGCIRLQCGTSKNVGRMWTKQNTCCARR